MNFLSGPSSTYPDHNIQQSFPKDEKCESQPTNRIESVDQPKNIIGTTLAVDVQVKLAVAVAVAMLLLLFLKCAAAVWLAMRVLEI